MRGSETSRRLIQDFVIAPVSIDSVLPRIGGHPSPLPQLVATAALRLAPFVVGERLLRTTGPYSEVRVDGERPRSDGWSVQLNWPNGRLGLPAFDGELVLHPLSEAATWIGLEGAVSVHEAGRPRSDGELRHAQLQIRDLLSNLAYELIP